MRLTPRGCLVPTVSLRPLHPIEQRNDRRPDRQRPQQAVRPKQPELHVARPEGHEQREQHPASPRIGRRLGVRNHEERENEERAISQAMQWNRDRFAEPGGAAEEEARVRAEEAERDVGPFGARHDDQPDGGNQERKERRLAPLTGRHPGVTRQQQRRNDAEVRRIEHVLSSNANGEFAPDCESRGDSGNEQ
jgi:hypothetical protein